MTLEDKVVFQISINVKFILLYLKYMKSISHLSLN